MHRIAILYICTGKYHIFWKEFYESCERHFLKDRSEKEYFVFTDHPKIHCEDALHIHKIFQESLKWPLPTLMRFHFFNKISEQLNYFDFIYFFNANMLFVDHVDEEILPFTEKLLVVEHPGYLNKDRNSLPYEMNSKSTAFIPGNQGITYYMGGLSGGLAETYLELIREIKVNIDKDFSQDIIAAWHDESHLNKYMLKKKPKILDPTYGYPEGWNLPFTPKIIIRDKMKYGGHNFLRDKKDKMSLIEYIGKAFAKITLKF